MDKIETISNFFNNKDEKGECRCHEYVEESQGLHNKIKKLCMEYCNKSELLTIDDAIAALDRVKSLLIRWSTFIEVENMLNELKEED